MPRKKTTKTTKQTSTRNGGKRSVMKKLTIEQRDFLLVLIAEGLTTPEINAQAELFEPPFKISPQLHTSYRRNHEETLNDMRKQNQFDAFTTGLSLAANRVNALMKLARELEEDLYQKKLVWVRRQKAYGGGKNFTEFEEDEFNKAEIQELRGIYDDIARETGGRVLKQDITSGGKPIKGYTTVSPDDWDDSKEKGK